MNFTNEGPLGLFTVHPLEVIVSNLSLYIIIQNHENSKTKTLLFDRRRDHFGDPHLHHKEIIFAIQPNPSEKTIMNPL